MADLHSASIRPRPRRDGTVAFDVRWRQDGASRSLSFDDDRSAARWRAILEKVGPDEALRIVGLDLAGSPTVDEYADRYINSKSGVEPKTLEAYRDFMRISITPAMGDLPIDAVSAETIAAWVRDQTAQGLAAKTIKNRHGFLSAMFAHAVDSGLLGKNPCKGTRMPATEREEMVFLSPDEFTELLNYVPLASQPLVLFLASTGLRWGEATALRWSDFDLSAQTVRVSRAWKSSREQGWYLGAPKTSRSKRTVSLPAELVNIMRPLVEARTEFVFLNKQGRPIRQTNFYEYVWDPARRLANGLPAHAHRKGQPWKARTRGEWDRPPAARPLGKMPRIHDLRHSHASWLIHAGVPLPVIQRRLGHESIQTTSDVYGHVAPDMQLIAANAVGVALAGAMPSIEA